MRADTISAQVHATALRRLGGAGFAFKLIEQLAGALAAVEQHCYAAAVVSDVLQATVQAPRVHGAVDFEGIEHRQRLVHAHRNGLVGLPLALDQRQMHCLARAVAKSMGGESAKSGLQRALADFFDQRLGANAVFDQVGNGANLQAMLGGKQLQVRQTRHGAVVFHDLADH